MTPEKAARVLVRAGLLDRMDAEIAVAVLVSRRMDLTRQAWVEALVQAWLLDTACTDAAIAAMRKEERKITWTGAFI
jgi:hypothetical protein